MKSTKIKKIIIIIICIAVICVITLFVVNKLVKKSSTEELNIDVSQKIEQYIQNANTSTERYIPICKNGKWGYVDNKGNVKIDYQYDKASMMGEVSLENDKEHLVNIAVVKENDRYIVIGENNDKIAELDIRKDEQNEWEEAGIFDSYDSSGVCLYSLLKQRSTVLNAEKLRNQYLIERNTYYANKYKAYQRILPNNEGKYELEIKNKKYYITIKEKDKQTDNIPTKCIISDGTRSKEIETNLYYNENEKFQDIYLYTDGYIPYCNIDEKIQGYYDENLNLKTIKGNYQILDIKDGYVIINQFDDEDKQIGIIILDKNNKIIKKFKQITTIENRYIVKKENDKIVFLDNNFNEISDEYDYISSRYVDGVNNFYMMGKKEESTTKYYMLNVENLQIINQDIEQFLIEFHGDDNIEKVNERNCQGYYALDDIYKIDNYDENDVGF